MRHVLILTAAITVGAVPARAEQGHVPIQFAQKPYRSRVQRLSNLLRQRKPHPRSPNLSQRSPRATFTAFADIVCSAHAT